MLDYIKNIKEFNFKTQKEFIQIYGTFCPNDLHHFKLIEFKEIPIFKELLIDLDITLDIGFQNYNLFAANKLVDILKTRKNYNKQASLFHVFISLTYGQHEIRNITKYWKKLDDDQKLKLDNVLNNHLVYCYNYQIEQLNYNLEGEK